MRVFFLCLVGVFVALFAGIYLLLLQHSPQPLDVAGVNPWIEIYFNQARVPMFTGFLTLGSFLLTLQTAIIQRLKEAYDTEKYAARFKVLKASQPGLRYYGGLERLGIALSVNVVLALSTSVAQFTIGFIRQEWSTALCVALAGTSISLIIFFTIQLLLAHKEWFAKIENEKRTELKGAE